MYSLIIQYPAMTLKTTAVVTALVATPNKEPHVDPAVDA
jgi:hypothetical protein